jgi:hypothetical protein
MASTTAEDPDLAVLALAGRPAVLPFHPGRLGPFLEEPRLIDHQDGRWVGQALAHVGDQVMAHRVPACRVPEPLHPIGRALPRLFSELPSILAPRVAEQPLEVAKRPSPWLGALEMRRDARVQRLRVVGPGCDLNAGRLTGCCGVIRACPPFGTRSSNHICYCHTSGSVGTGVTMAALAHSRRGLLLDSDMQAKSPSDSLVICTNGSPSSESEHTPV